MRRVTIFDYGAGNLHSLAKALAEAGIEVVVETDPISAIDTDVLVLPGVGSFSQAAGRLAAGRDPMREAMLDGLPSLGICLGMQLLFEESDEGPGRGLGIIPGRVTRLAARRVPQIGWNTLDDTRDSIFDTAPVPVAYFAHSFACRPVTDETVIAWTRHEDDRFAAAVRAGKKDNIVAVQFHPEKSSAAGVRFIRTFVGDAGRKIGSLRPSPSALHPAHP